MTVGQAGHGVFGDAAGRHSRPTDRAVDGHILPDEPGRWECPTRRGMPTSRNTVGRDAPLVASRPPRAQRVSVHTAALLTARPLHRTAAAIPAATSAPGRPCAECAELARDSQVPGQCLTPLRGVQASAHCHPDERRAHADARSATGVRDGTCNRIRTVSASGRRALQYGPAVVQSAGREPRRRDRWGRLRPFPSCTAAGAG